MDTQNNAPTWSQEGNRVRLRDWTLSDLDTFRSWNKGHHPWMDLNGPYYARQSTEEFEESMERITQKIAEGDWRRPQRTLVIADKESNALLGTVSRYWQSKETNWLSIGLVVYDDAHWGKGIGKAALELWISYLFETMPELVRLDMRTWSGNVGMMRLAEKLGFKEEARFRMARIVKGKYYDGMGYGLLREEWEAQTRSTTNL